MMRTRPYILAVAACGLLVAAVACSRDGSPTTPAGAVQASVTLASSAGPAAAAAQPGPLAEDGDGEHGFGGFGRIGKADIDSLMVDVSKVEVLAATADTENAADSAAEAAAGSGRRGDNDADDDHENDERTWVSLDVTAGGHLDLLMLPDSTQTGVTIATGALPPSTYRHVRLFVTNALIYLNNQIVTPAGDTLRAGVPIPVIIPSADSTGAAVKTDQQFTVTQGDTSIQLFFDADDTIRHVVVTGDGRVILTPVLWVHRDH
jgi:hypothetical protein